MFSGKFLNLISSKASLCIFAFLGINSRLQPTQGWRWSRWRC